MTIVSGSGRRFVVGRWLTFAGLLALASGIQAPSALAQETRGEYTGFLGAGVSKTATNQLDERLAASGYPAFGNSSGGVTLGAYRLLRSGAMLGGEWHFLEVGEAEHANRERELSGGYATIGVGYAVELSRKVRIYPRLGLGVAGMGLWIEDESAGSDVAINFDSALAGPRADPDNSTLSQGSMAVDLGAGAELLLGSRGPLLGLRLGYVATPFDQGWTRDGRSLSGAPKATVAGPYVRLVMGWRKRR